MNRTVRNRPTVGYTGQWFALDTHFMDLLWQALHGELFLPVIQGDPSFEPVGSMEP